MTEQVQILSRAVVAALLAAQDESCDLSRVTYFPDVHSLASTVSGQRNWSQGEVFVYAAQADRYLILKQVAPASCEMLVVSNKGFCDVLTAHLFEVDDLVLDLEGFMQD